MSTNETGKRGRSASLWNWFDRLLSSDNRRRTSRNSSTQFQVSYTVRQNADVTSEDELIVSCLTLDESPTKRRSWNPKRMTRPVSCHMLTSSSSRNEEKNRIYSETHFLSESIPQRVKASATTLRSLDTIDRQVR